MSDKEATKEIGLICPHCDEIITEIGIRSQSKRDWSCHDLYTDIHYCPTCMKVLGVSSRLSLNSYH